MALKWKSLVLSRMDSIIDSDAGVDDDALSDDEGIEGFAVS